MYYYDYLIFGKKKKKKKNIYIYILNYSLFITKNFYSPKKEKRSFLDNINFIL